MFWNRPLTARPAAPADRHIIQALARSEERVLLHLDWSVAEDWLGQQPFLLAQKGSRTIAALACPPAPPDTAWIRLLAIQGETSATDIWQYLWPPARAALTDMQVTRIAGLAYEDWLEPLYRSAGFEPAHTIVSLSRPGHLPAPDCPSPTTIRYAHSADHATLIAVDTQAFRPPWQLAPEVILRALAQAELVTVAEMNQRIVGYLLATPTAAGAHLARLAVLPGEQGRGLGAALTAHMINHYRRLSAQTLTVNTQASNAASLAVYQRLGFKLTEHKIPVYQLNLSQPSG